MELVKYVENIWNDAMTTIPENGIWILCYEDGGYPRLSNKGVLAGTTKWAFVDDLLKAYKVEFCKKKDK